MKTTKNSFDILLGSSFLILFGLFLYNRYLMSNRPKINLGPTIVKANDILKRKTKVPEKVLNTTVTSSACTLFLKLSAEHSLNDYANEFIDHNVDGILKTCAGAFPTPLQEQIDRTIMECKDSTRDQITKACYSALIKAKTASVVAIIKPDADPLDLNSTILLHLIADKFAREDWTENPEKTFLLLDTLLEKEPGYLNGYKAKLKLISKSELYKDQDYKDEFAATQKFIKRLSPKDQTDIAKFEFSLDDL